MRRQTLIFFFIITSLCTFAQSPKGTLYIFLARDCPICQYYTLNLKTLHKTFSDQGIDFKGVFSVPQASQASIEAFQETYELPFKLILDIDQRLMNMYEVSVTPEVVLVDGEGNVRYQGRIDDTYIKLGRRKRTAPHEDLKLALEAFTKQHEIAISRTQPVGCYITPLPK